MASQTTNSSTDEILLDLEDRLAGALKPIRPSTDVVQRLRERIHFPVRDELASRLLDWKRMFLVFGSVMSGLLVAITVARAFFYLVGRKHI
jgi:hypothetical protein